MEAYAEYRSIVISEFKQLLKDVNDQQLITFIEHIIGKSSMRLNLSIGGLKDDLIDRI